MKVEQQQETWGGDVPFQRPQTMAEFWQGSVQQKDTESQAVPDANGPPVTSCPDKLRAKLSQLRTEIGQLATDPGTDYEGHRQKLLCGYQRSPSYDEQHSDLLRALLGAERWIEHGPNLAVDLLICEMEEHSDPITASLLKEGLSYWYGCSYSTLHRLARDKLIPWSHDFTFVEAFLKFVHLVFWYRDVITQKAQRSMLDLQELRVIGKWYDGDLDFARAGILVVPLSKTTGKPFDIQRCIDDTCSSIDRWVHMLKRESSSLDLIKHLSAQKKVLEHVLDDLVDDDVPQDSLTAAKKELLKATEECIEEETKGRALSTRVSRQGSEAFSAAAPLIHMYYFYHRELKGINAINLGLWNEEDMQEVTAKFNLEWTYDNIEEVVADTIYDSWA